MIVIKGRPQPKQRPRKGKYGNFYTPKETQAYENKVGFASLVDKNKIKKGERCKLIIRIFFKGKQKGDIDNIIKICLDGMTKIVYNDDKCVKEIQAKILEHQQNERIEIEVFSLDKV